MPNNKEQQSNLTLEFLREQQVILEAGLSEYQRRASALLEGIRGYNIGEEVTGDFMDYLFVQKERTGNARQLDQLRSIIAQHRKAIFLVKKALKGEKNSKEEYGKCLNCGGQITVKRLKAAPWALLCTSCQQEQEMNNG